MMLERNNLRNVLVEEIQSCSAYVPAALDGYNNTPDKLL